MAVNVSGAENRPLQDCHHTSLCGGGFHHHSLVIFMLLERDYRWAAQGVADGHAPADPHAAEERFTKAGVRFGPRRVRR